MISNDLFAAYLRTAPSLLPQITFYPSIVHRMYWFNLQIFPHSAWISPYTRRTVILRRLKIFLHKLLEYYAPEKGIRNGKGCMGCVLDPESCVSYFDSRKGCRLVLGISCWSQLLFRKPCTKSPSTWYFYQAGHVYELYHLIRLFWRFKWSAKGKDHGF